jgi:hypothetical protein
MSKTNLRYPYVFGQNTYMGIKYPQKMRSKLSTYYSSLTTPKTNPNTHSNLTITLNAVYAVSISFAASSVTFGSLVRAKVM